MPDHVAKQHTTLPAVKARGEQSVWRHVTEGRGSVVDEHTVTVELSAGGTKTLTTKYILIATGGKPVKAPIPGSVRPPDRMEFIVSSAASCNSLGGLGVCRQRLWGGGTRSGCSITRCRARGGKGFVAVLRIERKILELTSACMAKSV